MQIQLHIILNIIALVSSVILNKTCDRVKVGELYYEKKILWDNIGRPYNLNLYKSTNTLFFSYALPETYYDLDFQIGYYNIDYRNFEPIAGIKGGCAIAIDHYNDIVYLGGSDGIFKYNMMTKIADIYKERGKNIWSLFYKRNLFYVSYPTQKLHIEIDGKFSIVKEFESFEVDNFFVSSTNEIFFSNRSGFFKYDNDKLSAELVNEYIIVRQIVEDNEENMYISTNVGVFVNTNFAGLRKVINLRNIYGIAFDRNNNIIYSDDNSIVMLVPSSSGCADESD